MSRSYVIESSAHHTLSGCFRTGLISRWASRPWDSPIRPPSDFTRNPTWLLCIDQPYWWTWWLGECVTPHILRFSQPVFNPFPGYIIMYIVISHALRAPPGGRRDRIICQRSIYCTHIIIMYKMLVTLYVGDIFPRFYLIRRLFIWPPLPSRGIGAMEPAPSLNKNPQLHSNSPPS